jgi:hypothetical protein
MQLDLIGKTICPQILDLAHAIKTLLERPDRQEECVSKMIKANYEKEHDIVELLDRFKGEVVVMQSICATINFPYSDPFMEIDQNLLRRNCFKSDEDFQEHLEKTLKSASGKSRLLPRVCRLCIRVSTHHYFSLSHSALGTSKLFDFFQQVPGTGTAGNEAVDAGVHAVADDGADAGSDGSSGSPATYATGGSGGRGGGGSGAGAGGGTGSAIVPAAPAPATASRGASTSPAIGIFAAAAGAGGQSLSGTLLPASLAWILPQFAINLTGSGPEIDEAAVLEPPAKKAKH